MEKLKTNAKRLDVFFGILFWIVAVFCGIAVIANVVILITENSLAGTELSSWTLTMNGIHYEIDSLSEIDLRFAFTTLVIFFVIGGLFFMYAARVIRNMLKPMKNGEPFSSSISQGFKKLGWFSLIYGIVSIVIKEISQSIMLNAIELVDGGSKLLEVEHVYDATFIIVAALLFLFGYIFKYGEELQRQVDETL